MSSTEEAREEKPRMIVAEVSKIWSPGTPPDSEGRSIISQRFEAVIEENSARGYQLRDWKLYAVFAPPPPEGRTIEQVKREGTWTAGIIETIVAVFELEEPAADYLVDLGEFPDETYRPSPRVQELLRRVLKDWGAEEPRPGAGKPAERPRDRP